MTAALLTDKYELTMLAAALRDGTAQRRTTFEVFARRLPDGRRYGVVAGTGRFLEALAQFIFDDVALASLSDFLDADTLAYLADYRFRGDIDGYAEGELYFPGSPVLSVTAPSPNAWCSRRWRCRSSTTTPRSRRRRPGWSSAAEGRPLIEMGSRRTHEQAAVAAARAAYIAGFTGSSNLEAQRRYGVPALGTSAHAFTMLHTRPVGLVMSLSAKNIEWEQAAFRAQVDALGVGTTLLVDTYDITAGVANAVDVAGPELGAVRIDSGDLGVLARQVRAQLDELGATEDPDRGVRRPRRVLDRRAARRARRHATASAPRWSPARARRPRAWSTSWSRSTGCRWRNAAATRNLTAAARGATRLAKPSGTIVEEVVHPVAEPPPQPEPSQRELTVPLVRGGRARRGLGPRRGP